MTAERLPNRFALPGLYLAVLASALGLVYSSHVCREFYAELQTLEASRWTLQEDHSRLLLEESTLASPHRVATIAEDELGMGNPDVNAVQVVRQ